MESQEKRSTYGSSVRTIEFFKFYSTSSSIISFSLYGCWNVYTIPAITRLQTTIIVFWHDFHNVCADMMWQGRKACAGSRNRDVLMMVVFQKHQRKVNETGSP